MKRDRRIARSPLRAPPRPPADPRILVAVPSTGIVRFEWAMSFAGLIQPVNWSSSMTFPRIDRFGPIGFHVAKARNLCVEALLRAGHDWLFFLDHDTIPPPDLWVRLNQYTQSAKYPIVSGVYYHKGAPSYPLIFRGRGNGCYMEWRRGEKVWADGIPMGCALIHRRIFEHLPKVQLTDGTGGRGWFDTPRFAKVDPETNDFHKEIGTEDLDFCERVIRHKVLAKAGWPQLQRKKFPFLVDTGIWCTHISNDGQVFPSLVPKVGVRADAAIEAEF